MHLTIHEASLLVHHIDEAMSAHRNVEVVLAPGFLALQALHLQIDHKHYKLAAQDCYWRDEGAFTGEVAAHQLRGLVSYVLIGHSERRHIFHETARDIGRKVQAAIRHDIRPVLCVGETAMERQDGETAGVLHDQLVAGLANVTSEDMAKVVIAYEPVWAIGTGDNASAEEVREAAATIRSQITHLFGKTVAHDTPILYGGSVSSDNVASYMVNGIDGVLVGGASLRAEEFAQITNAVHKAKTGK